MVAVHVTPIGFESLGVRSMCTFVETPDIRVLIDAGVSLGPRFRKLPHPHEYQARDACRSKIREYAAKADVVVVSHYHNDHHTPNYTETVWLGSSAEESEQIYRDKIILAKDFRNAINFSQRRRGWMFQRFLKRIGSKYEVADGKMFEYGATTVKISEPVPHGEEDSGLGWVVMATISSRGETINYASDVQGPMSQLTAQIIVKEKPSLVVLGGPPLYLEGLKVNETSIENGIQNAARIAKCVPTLIFEHHLLRSRNWMEKAKPVYVASNKAGHRVIVAAEYLCIEPLLLEMQREQLYEEVPPSQEFMKWTALPNEKRRKQPPPV